MTNQKMMNRNILYIALSLFTLFSFLSVSVSGQSTATCSDLYVDVSTQCLIPCEESTFIVKYCNYGTLTAANSTVKVKLDKDLSFVSASAVPIAQSGNEFTFDLGDINPNFCGKLEVIAQLDCDVTPGAGHCVEATIFPNDGCEEPSPLWNESSLIVESECVGDSIFYEIQNVGEGDMTQETQFYIVIDDLIVMLEEVQLNSGQSLIIGMSAEQGSTFYAEAGQSNYHPGFSFPNVVLEGCPADANFEVGFLTQFPENDQNLYKDITCFENMPVCVTNGKIAFPEGLGEEHYINQNQSIEYQINFSNDGDQPLQNLIICDTLSPYLDPNSLLEGVSTNDYVVEVDSNIVKFIFENINLDAGESGFVKFTVSQVPDNPPGTVIENQAVIIAGMDTTSTNSVFHTIPEPMVTNEYIDVCMGDYWEGNLITEDIVLCDTVYFSVFTSIIHVNITALDTSLIVVDEMICQGELYEFEGELFSQAGTYTFTYEGANGCDSTHMLNLEVLPNYNIVLTETIQEGESFTVGQNVYTESGIYTNLLTSQNGCDSTVILNLEVLPNSFQNCSVNAGADTLICSFSYLLIADPEGGTWELLCEISDGEVAYDSSGLFTTVNFTNCGSYFFKYELTSIEELTVFDSLLMDSISVLDTCIAVDFLRIDVQDPSTRQVVASVDMDLGYNDYTCPESEELWCKNFYEVEATNPEAIWKFILSGNCLTTIIQADTTIGQVSECVVSHIEFDTTLFSGGFEPMEVCVSQDAFADVDEENLEIIDNNFWEFLDSLIAVTVWSAAADCPAPPLGCAFPSEEIEIDSSMADTILRIVPIRKGGFWQYLNEDGEFVALSDTTFLEVDDENYVLLVTPGATTYNGAGFALFGVEDDGEFVAPFGTVAMTFDWEEVWCYDTTYQIRYPSSGLIKDGLYNLFQSPIPPIPGFGCGAFTVTFNKQMEIVDQIISCDESGYIVQIDIIGGYEPHSVTGGPGTLNGTTFTSDLIPIDQPYFFTVMDSCICVRSVSGDACPCISPTVLTPGFVEMTCFDPCVELLAGVDAQTSHPLDFTWFQNGGGQIGSGANVTVCDPGYYLFQAVDLVTGCIDVGGVNVDIFLPQADISAPNEALNCYLPSQQICGTEITGVPNPVLTWDGPGISDPSNLCPIIEVGGLYTFNVYNPDNGCEDTQSIFVGEDFSVPIASVGEDLELDCFENPISLDGSTSSPNDLIYEWTSIEGNNIDNSGNSIASVSQDGTYILTVIKPDNGCEDTDTLVVTPFPGISFEASSEEACWNEDNGSINTFEVIGAAMPYSFSLDGLNFQTDSIFENLAAGNYQVTMQDDNGCLDSLEINVEMIAPLPAIVLDEEYHICNDSILLEANEVFDLLDVAYLWSNEDDQPFTYINEQGEHFLQIANKCEVKTEEFTIIDDFINWDFFEIPNAFTPNGDGTNDLFRPIRITEPIPYDFMIYDRWGKRIYQTNQDLPGWDGTRNGKAAKSDVYVWKLVARIESCAGTVKEISLKGDVTLIR